MEIAIAKIDELKKLNPKGFSNADYVNYISRLSENPIDVARCFSEVFFPIFDVKDGLPFNESFGCYKKYIEYNQKGIEISESYYWSHVVDVEGLLNIDSDLANVIADRMCYGWNEIISKLGFKGVVFHKIQGDEVVVAPLCDPDLFTRAIG